MKRLINVVAVIAMLGCCNLYAEDGGTAQAAENVADKGDAQEQVDKGNKPREKDVPELKEEATKPERTVDYSLYVAILALLTAAVSIVLLLQYKGKAANEKKHLDSALERLGNDLSTLNNSLKKQVKDLKSDLSDLNNEISEVKSQRAAAPVKPEPQVIQQPAKPEFSKEVVYSVYQSGDNCFDSEDFSKTPGSSLPFKLTLLSPTEAEVEVMPDYDRSLNSQVKDVCEAVSGSWTEFHALTTSQKGVLYKDSEESACWKIKSKIQVRLS
mgnify:FL=1